jgi:hypothetical protein
MIYFHQQVGENLAGIVIVCVSYEVALDVQRFKATHATRWKRSPQTACAQWLASPLLALAMQPINNNGQDIREELLL